MSNENVFESLMNGVSEMMTAQANPSGEREWWQAFNFPETPKFDPLHLVDCARSALFGAALNGGPAVHEFLCTTNSNSNWPKKLENVHNYVTNELGARLVYTQHRIMSFYVFKGGAIFVHRNEFCNLHVVGTSKAHMQMAEELNELLV